MKDRSINSTKRSALSKRKNLIENLMKKATSAHSSSMKKLAFQDMADKLRREGRLPNNLREYLVGPIIGINIYPGANFRNIVDEVGDVNEYYVTLAENYWNIYMPDSDYTPTRNEIIEELINIYNDHNSGVSITYPKPKVKPAPAVTITPTTKPSETVAPEQPTVTSPVITTEDDTEPNETSPVVTTAPAPQPSGASPVITTEDDTEEESSEIISEDDTDFSEDAPVVTTEGDIGEELSEASPDYISQLAEDIKFIYNEYSKSLVLLQIDSDANLNDKQKASIMNQIIIKETKKMQSILSKVVSFSAKNKALYSASLIVESAILKTLDMIKRHISNPGGGFKIPSIKKLVKEVSGGSNSLINRFLNYIDRLSSIAISEEDESFEYLMLSSIYYIFEKMDNQGAFEDKEINFSETDFASDFKELKYDINTFTYPELESLSEDKEMFENFDSLLDYYSSLNNHSNVNLERYTDESFDYHYFGTISGKSDTAEQKIKKTVSRLNIKELVFRKIKDENLVVPLDRAKKYLNEIIPFLDPKIQEIANKGNSSSDVSEVISYRLYSILLSIASKSFYYNKGSEALSEEVTVDSEEALSEEVTVDSEEALSEEVTADSDEALSEEVTVDSDEALSEDKIKAFADKILDIFKRTRGPNSNLEMFFEEDENEFKVDDVSNFGSGPSFTSLENNIANEDLVEYLNSINLDNFLVILKEGSEVVDEVSFSNYHDSKESVSDSVSEEALSEEVTVDSEEFSEVSSSEESISESHLSKEQIISSLNSNYSPSEAYLSAVKKSFNNIQNWSNNDFKNANMFVNSGIMQDMFLEELSRQNKKVFSKDAFAFEIEGKIFEISTGGETENDRTFLEACKNLEGIELNDVSGMVFYKSTVENDLQELKDIIAEKAKQKEQENRDNSPYFVNSIIENIEAIMDVYISNNLKNIFDSNFQKREKNNIDNYFLGSTYKNLIDIFKDMNVAINIESESFNSSDVMSMAKTPKGSYSKDFYEKLKAAVDANPEIIFSEKGNSFMHHRFGIPKITEEYCLNMYKQIVENEDPIDKISKKYNENKSELKAEAEEVIASLSFFIKKQNSIIQRTILGFNISNNDATAIKILYSIVGRSSDLDISSMSNALKQASATLLVPHIDNNLIFDLPQGTFNIRKEEASNIWLTKYSFENPTEVKNVLDKQQTSSSKGKIDSMQRMRDAGDYHGMLSNQVNFYRNLLSGAMQSYASRNDVDFVDYESSVREHGSNFIKSIGTIIRNEVPEINSIFSNYKKEFFSDLTHHLFVVKKIRNPKPKNAFDFLNEEKSKKSYPLFQEIRNELLKLTYSKFNAKIGDSGERKKVIKENMENISSLVAEGKVAEATKIAKTMKENFFISNAELIEIIKIIKKSKNSAEKISKWDGEYSYLFPLMNYNPSAETGEDVFYFEDRFLQEVKTCLERFVADPNNDYDDYDYAEYGSSGLYSAVLMSEDQDPFPLDKEKLLEICTDFDINRSRNNEKQNIDTVKAAFIIGSGNDQAYDVTYNGEEYEVMRIVESYDKGMSYLGLLKVEPENKTIKAADIKHFDEYVIESEIEQLSFEDFDYNDFMTAFPKDEEPELTLEEIIASNKTILISNINEKKKKLRRSGQDDSITEEIVIDGKRYNEISDDILGDQNAFDNFISKLNEAFQDKMNEDLEESLETSEEESSVTEETLEEESSVTEETIEEESSVTEETIEEESSIERIAPEDIIYGENIFTDDVESNSKVKTSKAYNSLKNIIKECLKQGGFTSKDKTASVQKLSSLVLEKYKTGDSSTGFIRISSDTKKILFDPSDPTSLLGMLIISGEVVLEDDSSRAYTNNKIYLNENFTESQEQEESFSEPEEVSLDQSIDENDDLKKSLESIFYNKKYFRGDSFRSENKNEDLAFKYIEESLVRSLQELGAVSPEDSVSIEQLKEKFFDKISMFIEESRVESFIKKTIFNKNQAKYSAVGSLINKNIVKVIEAEYSEETSLEDMSFYDDKIYLVQNLEDDSSEESSEDTIEVSSEDLNDQKKNDKKALKESMESIFYNKRYFKTDGELDREKNKNENLAFDYIYETLINSLKSLNAVSSEESVSIERLEEEFFEQISGIIEKNKVPKIIKRHIFNRNQKTYSAIARLEGKNIVKVNEEYDDESGADRAFKFYNDEIYLVDSPDEEVSAEEFTEEIVVSDQGMVSEDDSILQVNEVLSFSSIDDFKKSITNFMIKDFEERFDLDSIFKKGVESIDNSFEKILDKLEDLDKSLIKDYLGYIVNTINDLNDSKELNKIIRYIYSSFKRKIFTYLNSEFGVEYSEIKDYVKEIYDNYKNIFADYVVEVAFKKIKEEDIVNEIKNRKKTLDKNKADALRRRRSQERADEESSDDDSYEVEDVEYNFDDADEFDELNDDEEYRQERSKLSQGLGGTISQERIEELAAETIINNKIESFKKSKDIEIKSKFFNPIEFFNIVTFIKDRMNKEDLISEMIYGIYLDHKYRFDLVLPPGSRFKGKDGTELSMRDITFKEAEKKVSNSETFKRIKAAKKVTFNDAMDLFYEVVNILKGTVDDVTVGIIEYYKSNFEGLEYKFGKESSNVINSEDIEVSIEGNKKTINLSYFINSHLKSEGSSMKDFKVVSPSTGSEITLEEEINLDNALGDSEYLKSIKIDESYDEPYVRVIYNSKMHSKEDTLFFKKLYNNLYLNQDYGLLKVSDNLFYLQNSSDLLFDLIGEGNAKVGKDIYLSVVNSINNKDRDSFNMVDYEDVLEGIKKLSKIKFSSYDDFIEKSFARINNADGDHKFIFTKDHISEETLKLEFNEDFKPREVNGEVVNTREKGMNYFGIEIMGHFYSSKYIKDQSAEGDNVDIIIVDSEEDAMKQLMEYQKESRKMNGLTISGVTLSKVISEDFEKGLKYCFDILVGYNNVLEEYGKRSKYDNLKNIIYVIGRELCSYPFYNFKSRDGLLDDDFDKILLSKDIYEDYFEDDKIKKVIDNYVKNFHQGAYRDRIRLGFNEIFKKINGSYAIYNSVYKNSYESFKESISLITTKLILNLGFGTKGFVNSKNRNIKDLKELLLTPIFTVEENVNTDEVVVVDSGEDISEKISTYQDNIDKVLNIYNRRFLRRKQRLSKKEDISNLIITALENQMNLYKYEESLQFLRENLSEEELEKLEDKVTQLNKDLDEYYYS